MADFTNARLTVIGAFITKYAYDVIYRPDLHYNRPSLAGSLFCLWYFTVVYFVNSFVIGIGTLDWIDSMYSYLNITTPTQEQIERVYTVACMFFHVAVGLVWYTHSTIYKVYNRMIDIPWDEVDRLYGFFMIPIVFVSGVRLVLAA